MTGGQGRQPEPTVRTVRTVRTLHTQKTLEGCFIVQLCAQLCEYALVCVWLPGPDEHTYMRTHTDRHVMCVWLQHSYAAA